ncbi:MAG TPA: hypothetical protein VF063_00770 [Gaiellaceae bacterium]
MKGRTTIIFAVAALALLGGTASATPIKWISVPLGTHRFGQLQRPEAVVARAGPSEVGFKKQGGCGCADGPAGPVLFDVSRGGSIWVFDVLNHRFLVWQRGRPAHPARTLAFPKLDIRDFVLGRNGTVYLSAVYAEPPAGDSGANLWALSPRGKVLWRVKALTGGSLRVGPSGAVYGIGVRSASSWTPLTTPGGRPLSLVQQRRGTTSFQPLGGGLHLVATQVGSHEAHYALVDKKRTIVKAWKVTSRTQILASPSLTPALVRGDLVAAVDVSRGTRLQHIVLRLSPSGARAQISVDAKAVYGAGGAETVTALKVGSDGRLYQLRTNPKTGLAVASYSLGR